MSYPPNYGQQDPYQQPGYGYPPQPTPTKTNGLAVASLVLGLTGFITCGFTSLLAIVFGHVSLGQIKRDRTDGHGMALAGVVLGWLLTSLWILYWALVMAGAIAGVGASLSPPSPGSGRVPPSSSSAAPQTGSHTVVFEAVGTDGASSALNITSSANYHITQDNGVPLPYRKELKVDELNHFYFWVQNATATGKITCRILIDGKVAREEVEDGAYGVCRVTADKP